MSRDNNKTLLKDQFLIMSMYQKSYLHDVHSMHINENKLFTPCRNLKKGKKLSDHNAIILYLKGQLQRKHKLLSYKSASKMLKNDICITVIG